MKGGRKGIGENRRKKNGKRGNRKWEEEIREEKERRKKRSRRKGGGGGERDGKKWALQGIEPVPGLLKSRENEKKGSLQNRTYA